jgi:hypothetical protein
VAPAEVDPHRPFIEMGLDSLMAIEVQNQIGAAYAASLPLADLLRGMTVAELALRLEQHPSIEWPPDAIAVTSIEADRAGALLSQIDRLSPTEVEALLALLDREDGVTSS